MMIAQLVKELKNTDGPVDLNEICRKYGVQRSALDGMIELLVKQGKVVRYCPGSCHGCSYCGSRCMKQ